MNQLASSCSQRPVAGSNCALEFFEARKIDVPKNQHHGDAQHQHDVPAQGHAAVAGCQPGRPERCGVQVRAGGKQQDDCHQYQRKKTFENLHHQHRSRLRVHRHKCGWPQRKQYECHAAQPDDASNQVEKFGVVVHG